MTFFGMALLTAAGTIVLAVFAIVTAWYARRAFLKQTEEVSDQRRQFEQDATARRRAQAARVFILIESGDNRHDQTILTATAHNTSEMPVYDLLVQWRSSSGEFGTASVVPHLLPASTKPFEILWTEDAGPSRIRVSLDFRDAAGVIWRTNNHGNLSELCGVTSPALVRQRCVYSPRHDGTHSWQRAQPPADLSGALADQILAGEDLTTGA